VSIGDNTVIAAQTGIAGSTSIGSNCMIGGQVGFAGHISVADGVKIAAQSGVTKSIREPNGVWQGTPASLIKEHQIQLIELRKLVRNKALERISEIEKQLEG
jgi:UDP-3-O-[3-hydroxymyristoyl] glucosamine N-acyltransferase